MRISAIKVAVGGMLIGMGLIITTLGLRPVGAPRLPCGHVDETFRSVAGFKDWVKGTPHTCTGGRVVTDLQMFRDAQGIFQKDFQRPITDLVELEPYAEWMQRRSYALQYTKDAEQWSVSVDRTSRLPGFYLLTMDGRVYFDEWRRATTNDVCLRQVKNN
jgi:hypothetical protein